MKRTLLAALLFALPLAALAAGNPQRMIVVTRQPAAGTMAKASDIGFVFDGTHEARTFTSINGFVATLTEDELARVKLSPTVAWVEPVVEVHAFEVHDDSSTRTLVPSPTADTITPGSQITPWGVALVNAPAVWPATRGRALNGSGPIHVAILDSGIDYNHPELKNAYKGGFNFLLDSNDPLDDLGHGTHVAGIIAAANNSEGVVGVASDVDLYSLKVLDNCGSGNNSNIISAIDWVRSKKKEIGGNWIVNMSFGVGAKKGVCSGGFSPAERDAYQAAASDGILIYAASGNEAAPCVDYPAAYPAVNAVGALNHDSAVTGYSNSGPELKVTAPGGEIFSDGTGEDVLSTFIDGQITLPDGTKSLARFPNGFDTTSKEICLDRQTMSGPFVFCGTGAPSEIPSTVSGKIALIQRGGTDPNDSTGFFFSAKMKYAKAAGAIGVIVYNIPGRPMISPALTKLDPMNPAVIPFALISEQDGATLKANPNGQVTVAFKSTAYSSMYDSLEGTSMATPHATAVAALVWAAAPTAKASDVENAIEQTAKDLGDKGRDNSYGFGLVNALDAAKLLNPSLFSITLQPLPTSPVPSGRRATKRGR
jgi:subtilisin family serine protease